MYRPKPKPEEEEYKIGPIKILYQDNDYIAVYKPAGLLVHRTALDREDRVFLIQLLRNQINAEVHPCHRLDKATSGVMLLALNKEALRSANAAFAQNEVTKTYLAISRGWIDSAGEIDYPLRLEDTDSGKQSEKEFIQEAVTQYVPLKRFEIPVPLGRYSTSRFTLCHLNPKTGRRHQLRRHLAHLRHPIIGDTTHGDGLQNKFARSYLNCNRLLLVATELSFIHPESREKLIFRTEPDLSFSAIVEQLERESTLTE